VFYCDICKSRQSSDCWCDDEDLERAERMINEIADDVKHGFKLSWYDNTAYTELNIADLCNKDMPTKVCPMLSQLHVYLNWLECELDVAESTLLYDPQFKHPWWQLLVLRGERVSSDDNTDCEFNHDKSGHGEK
jgi:hypothetical protein